MKQILPNMRLLTLASEVRGEDWLPLSQRIDQQLEQQGLELAEESVYLWFNRSPAAVLAGEAECRVGRSVIGPRKDYPEPLKQWDWKSASVQQFKLRSKEWEPLLHECQQQWEELQRQGSKLASSFTIKLSRRLEPDLTLAMEVFFHE